MCALDDLQFWFVNEVLCEMFGLSRAELPGTDGRRLFKDDEQAAMVGEIHKRAEGFLSSVVTEPGDDCVSEHYLRCSISHLQQEVEPIST